MAFDPGPAHEALARLLPRHADQVRLRPAARDGAADRFGVTGTEGRITVEGTSPAVLLTGFHWYLKHAAGVAAGWPGSSVERLPVRLPAPEPVAALHREALVPNRFALNDTHEGYTGPYRGWEDWEREIDLLALSGINQVLVTVGQESVYHRVFQEFGYDGAELRAWIPGPAHQPWWLLQNLAGFGGPVSEPLLRARADLGLRVVRRLRSLGMQPVFPGWFGTVPEGFARRNPGARTVPQGEWLGFRRPDWLDPRDPCFTRVGEAFYRHQAELFGEASLYKMDPLHEGGQAGGVPVGEAARSVLAVLDAARPGATWVLLGWRRNPPRALVEAVDPARLLIVDGLADRSPEADRGSRWPGVPYAFGTIPNFGGHTSLGANTGVWLERFPRCRERAGGTLAGIALMPEGMGASPAANELFTELAWRRERIDGAAWFAGPAGYADRRYGGADPHARSAWELIASTAYATPGGHWSEPHDSLFAARPSLGVRSAASWSPKERRYDTAVFERALGELVRVAPALRETDAYRFDTTDVARQALANRSRVMLPGIEEAFLAGDREVFGRLTDAWLEAMGLLDEVLASDRRFLLGRWIADAVSWASDTKEAARLEFDCRTVLAVWGPRGPADAHGLHDYANREWAGLVRDLYLPRWRRFFATLDRALETGEEPAAVDWFAMEDAWTRGRGGYATATGGDPRRTATRVLEFLERNAEPQYAAVGG